jgi:hypothetical protein
MSARRQAKAEKPKAPPLQAPAPNRRSLEVIADEIHKHKRVDMFVVGDLLLEARDGCEHGEWYDWLYDNFEWSEDTADHYMNVARLVARFPKFRDLKLAKTTFYSLDPDDEDLPAIYEALVKRGALKRQLKPAVAEEVIDLVRLRRKHGDFPDATLLALDRGYGVNDDKIIAALKKKKPTTEAAVDKIVAGIEKAAAALESDGGGDHEGGEEEEAAEGPETAATVSPPAEPSPAPNLASRDFDTAISRLKQLMTKPAAQFAGTVISAGDLEHVVDFIRAVAKALTPAQRAIDDEEAAR